MTLRPAPQTAHTTNTNMSSAVAARHDKCDLSALPHRPRSRGQRRGPGCEPRPLPSLPTTHPPLQPARANHSRCSRRHRRHRRHRCRCRRPARLPNPARRGEGACKSRRRASKGWWDAGAPVALAEGAGRAGEGQRAHLWRGAIVEGEVLVAELRDGHHHPAHTGQGASKIGASKQAGEQE